MSISQRREVLHVERTSPPVQRSLGDFWLVYVATTVLVLLILIDGSVWIAVPLRIGLGLLYVLFVPGYCLTVALFPYKYDLDTPTRLGLSCGLSIVIIPILALVLDKLPWGIHPLPILLAEWSITALGIFAALVRFSQLPPETICSPLPFRLNLLRGNDLPLDQHYAWIGGATLVLVSLVGALWFATQSYASRSPTEFYLLGRHGLAQEYPLDAQLGERLSATVGIMNREPSPATYRVEIWVVGSWNSVQRSQVLASGPYQLLPSERSERLFQWSMTHSGDYQRVEFLLFKGIEQTPYRRLYLWVDVHPKST